MLGCSLHCPFCQNWVISQTLRDPHSGAWPKPVTPDELVASARERDCEAIISTYNEPLITAEWAEEIFKSSRAEGLVTGFVSNGYVTPEVLEYLRPWVDLFNVDLKTFSDRRYHELGCRLAPVLEGLRLIYEMGYWLEVVTLVVPGFNDSEAELRQIAEFLAGISVDIPWHVTAFHGAYRMESGREANAEDLARAVEVGRAAGLRFVYCGNLPAGSSFQEDTYCPDCGALLIRRQSGRVLDYLVGTDGRCPSCSAALPGRWGQPLERKALHRSALPWLSHYCG
jgi:pyruvate formate lyase activating enzyme